MTSLYFEELIERYGAEIEDLRSDSEGKDILKKRLQEKRSAFASLMPMLECAPEMVAPALHGAFSFTDRKAFFDAALCEPWEVDFPSWKKLKTSMEIAPWARPLIDTCLKEEAGECFLVTTAVLECMLAGDYDYRHDAPKATEDEDQDDDEGAQDLREAGEGWMTEQGFDAIDH